MTGHGHRVTVYLDPRREERGEEWDQGLAAGLLHSLCFFPLLSYGSTAPLASLGDDTSPPAVGESWPAMPLGLRRLRGAEEDNEDGVLKAERGRGGGGGYAQGRKWCIIGLDGIEI